MSAAQYIAYNGAFIQGPRHGKKNDGCVSSRLISTEPGEPIGAKLSLQMNHASICETMITAFMLDAMSASATFQSTLFNDILAKHLEFWSWVFVHFVS